MALSAALCKSCHSTLLRRSSLQRTFKHATAKHLSRPVVPRLDRRIHSKQATATAPPAGLAIPPWTDSEEQKQASLGNSKLQTVVLLNHLVTGVLSVGTEATPGQNEQIRLRPT